MLRSFTQSFAKIIKWKKLSETLFFSLRTFVKQIAKTMQNKQLGFCDSGCF